MGIGENEGIRKGGGRKGTFRELDTPQLLKYKSAVTVDA